MKTRICLLMGWSFLAFLYPATATVWDLSDGNSNISISDDTAHGAFAWGVDGFNQVAAGNFWYREGLVGGESFLGSTGPVSSSQPTTDFLTLTYDLGNFTLQADYQLQGGTVGSMESRFFETITVSNSSAASLNLNLFQEWKYLFGNRTNNTMHISAGNRIKHEEDGMFGESSYSPDPDHFTAIAGSLIPELLDGNPTTFGDNSGPVGPGVLDAGFQWDFTLGVGENQTFTVEHHVFVVPEPSTIILMMIAGLGCWMRRLRFRRISA